MEKAQKFITYLNQAKGANFRLCENRETRKDVLLYILLQLSEENLTKSLKGRFKEDKYGFHSWFFCGGASFTQKAMDDWQDETLFHIKDAINKSLKASDSRNLYRKIAEEINELDIGIDINIAIDDGYTVFQVDYK